jgi:hypothetical protein
VREELGFDYPGGPLLVVDWVAPHDSWDDCLMFVFDGGTLTVADQARIRLPDGELREWRFHRPADASRLLRPYVWRRVAAALAAADGGITHYLHDGEPGSVRFRGGAASS